MQGDRSTYNISDITNSNLSNFDQGEHNTVVATLNAAGQPELAQELSTLTKTVLASHDLPADQKEEQVKVINQIGKEAAEPNVAYKADIDDSRESLSFEIITITKIFAFLLFISLLYIVVLYKVIFYSYYHFWGIAAIYSAIASTFLLSRFLFVYFYKDNHNLNIPQEKIMWPDISFIIACKNEEKSIYKTIEACMESNYTGRMKCIAVNDGSTDDTLAEMHKAKQKYGEFLQIISFDKNKGKREAMAEGVLEAEGEIIVFVDSDSFIKRDTLNLLIKHFLIDEKVGAVSGNTTVENKNKNLLTKMQSARYGISYDIFKASESVFCTVTCCPGCFSAYRKKALDDILSAWRNQKFLGTKSTFGDDRSLTNFVLRDWKVMYCEKAKASTIVPETYKKFFTQQLRWKKSWVREGTTAARFIWKKHPLASLSFYISVLLPIP